MGTVLAGVDGMGLLWQGSSIAAYLWCVPAAPSSFLSLLSCLVLSRPCRASAQPFVLPALLPVGLWGGRPSVLGFGPLFLCPFGLVVVVGGLSPSSPFCCLPVLLLSCWCFRTVTLLDVHEFYHSEDMVI